MSPDDKVTQPLPKLTDEEILAPMRERDAQAPRRKQIIFMWDDEPTEEMP